ncbi:NAD(P)H-binding protein [Leifsonia sp. fls2-241-R2A-40a]|uniref:NAD(P)H-binding protein n=1 Tax=Leifsonia sp. fls2-241-R2A-40a TaxID=3040290 RepID=UPI00254E4FA3|nr:NAD(P)H-binding protein [Leifsonia sp. fls2-241-R2A-40a]
MSTLLLLGGTGKVGRRLTDRLRANGHDVRAVGRTSTPPFDWRDETTWSAALTGVDGVFIVGPGSATDWSPLLDRFLTTAAEHGVGRAVLLSARGVEFLPDGAVAHAEAALRNGPLSWTILRPAHFAQNFTEAMFVPDGGVIFAPVAGGREPFIDVQDIADVAAAALTEHGYGDRILELSGPRSLDFEEAAATLSNVSGTAVRYIPEPDEAHVERLQAQGLPAGYIEWRMAMLRGIASGADEYLSADVETVLGRPATPFEDWARREVPAATWASSRNSRSASPS